MSIKRVFVSDIHMSTGLSFGSLQGCYDWFDKDEAQKFEQFLEYLIGDDSIKEVIFLGDMMDGWVYPIEIQPPKYDRIANASHIVNIMTKLQKLAQSKEGKVTYVIGNHDITLMEPQFDNFRQTAFSGITFQNTPYVADGIHAEHGHQFAMYNAADPIHELPLGHYISRLAATFAERNQHHYTASDIETRFHSADNYITDDRGFIKDPLVNAPLTYLAEELGNVDDDTSIITIDGGAITLGEIRKQYERLGIDWIESHGLLDGIRSVWREAVGLYGVAYQIASADRSKKVVIFGHTHKKENCLLNPSSPGISPGPEEPAFAIYANCGAWCQGVAPTYIEDEYDEGSGTHKVSLKYWNSSTPDEVYKI